MLRHEAITTRHADIAAIRSLYFSSFSEAEQAPFWFIVRRAKVKDINFRAYYDGEVFAGFAYFVAIGDLTYLGFIAISPDSRSKGYGSQIMAHIESCYPENRIILCIEKVNEAAENNQQRIRRRDFYLRNGYSSSGLIVEEKGEDFELLVKGGDCSKEDFYTAIKKFAGPLVFPFIKPKLKAMDESISSPI